MSKKLWILCIYLSTLFSNAAKGETSFSVDAVFSGEGATINVETVKTEEGATILWSRPSSVHHTSAAHSTFIEESDYYIYSSALHFLSPNGIYTCKKFKMYVGADSIPVFTYAYFANKLYALAQVVLNKSTYQVYACEVDLSTFQLGQVQLIYETERISKPTKSQMKIYDQTIYGVPRIETSANHEFLLISDKIMAPDNPRPDHAIRFNIKLFHQTFNNIYKEEIIDCGKGYLLITDIDLTDAGIVCLTSPYIHFKIKGQKERSFSGFVILKDTLSFVSLPIPEETPIYRSSTTLTADGRLIWCSGYYKKNWAAGGVKGLYIFTHHLNGKKPDEVNTYSLEELKFENNERFTKMIQKRDYEVISDLKGNMWIAIQYVEVVNVNFTIKTLFPQLDVIHIKTNGEIVSQQLKLTHAAPGVNDDHCNTQPYYDTYFKTYHAQPLDGNLHILMMESATPTEYSFLCNQLYDYEINQTGTITKKLVKEFDESAIRPVPLYMFSERTQDKSVQLLCLSLTHFGLGTVHF